MSTAWAAWAAWGSKAGDCRPRMRRTAKRGAVLLAAYQQDRRPSSLAGCRATFKRWLEAHVASCNDNDDPTHDSTLIALAPAENGAAGALAPEQPYFGLAGAGSRGIDLTRL